MQVMPATGKDLAVGDITKVESNIHAGVKYFRFMLDEFYKDDQWTKSTRADDTGVLQCRPRTTAAAST
jgi:soluble lytic murein transglycosylase-like protein